MLTSTSQFGRALLARSAAMPNAQPMWRSRETGAVDDSGSSGGLRILGRSLGLAVRIGLSGKRVASRYSLMTEVSVMTRQS